VLSACFYILVLCLLCVLGWRTLFIVSILLVEFLNAIELITLDFHCNMLCYDTGPDIVQEGH